MNWTKLQVITVAKTGDTVKIVTGNGLFAEGTLIDITDETVTLIIEGKKNIWRCNVLLSDIELFYISESIREIEDNIGEEENED